MPGLPLGVTWSSAGRQHAPISIYPSLLSASKVPKWMAFSSKQLCLGEVILDLNLAVARHGLILWENDATGLNIILQVLYWMTWGLKNT